MSDIPGVIESCLERVRTVVVSIGGEQYPTVPLAEIPEGPIVEVARELKIAKRHQAEVEVIEDSPEIEGVEQLVKVTQVALNIHVRE